MSSRCYLHPMQASWLASAVAAARCCAHVGDELCGILPLQDDIARVVNEVVVPGREVLQWLVTPNRHKRDVETFGRDPVPGQAGLLRLIARAPCPKNQGLSIKTVSEPGGVTIRWQPNRSRADSSKNRSRMMLEMI